MKNLTELTLRQHDKVIDVFKVRCFHTAYMTLHNINNNAARFAEAIAQTSDTVLDIAKPEVREAFYTWYYQFYSKKWGGRRKMA